MATINLLYCIVHLPLLITAFVLFGVNYCKDCNAILYSPIVIACDLVLGCFLGFLKEKSIAKFIAKTIRKYITCVLFYYIVSGYIYDNYHGFTQIYTYKDKVIYKISPLDSR